jgi:hypothetical protein
MKIAKVGASLLFSTRAPAIFIAGRLPGLDRLIYELSGLFPGCGPTAQWRADSTVVSAIGILRQ